MLFKVLLVVLVLYVMATPIIYARAVKFGIKIAEKPEKRQRCRFLLSRRRKKSRK